jgi:hypothetical protein
MSTFRSSLIVSAVLAAVMAGSSAQAAIIYPTVATGSSSYPGYNDFYAIDTNANTDWASFGGGAGSFLKMDLGALYSLNTAFVTDRVTSGGGNGSLVFGLYDFTLQYSLQAYTDATFTTPIGPLFLVNPTLPGSPSSTTDFLTTVPLSGTARYIEYKVLSVNQALGAYNNPGLSDIHFAASAVPEPASWAMMILGFAGVGFFAYRRKGNYNSSVRFT